MAPYRRCETDPQRSRAIAPDPQLHPVAERGPGPAEAAAVATSSGETGTEAPQDPVMAQEPTSGAALVDPDELDRVREDLDALSGVPHRHAASEGERAMLHQVKSRLPEGVQGRIQGFVAYPSPAFVVGAHAAALLLSGLLGVLYPHVAAALCGIATVSLVAEGTGKWSLLRWLLPKSASYNLVVHLPARDKALGAVVVAAPLDVPRWKPERPRWLRRPTRPVVGAAVIVTGILLLRALAEPWGRPTQGMYVASLLILGAAVSLAVIAHRRLGGVHEDASGPAALLELIRRVQHEPRDNMDVWAVFTGCGHAYQNGMHAFLAVHRRRLVDPVLVVALDDPGRSPLGAVVSEGPLWPQHHRPTGPALIERLRWAGAKIPVVDTPNVTDARAAMLMGYRAIALAGGEEPSRAESTVWAVDVMDAMLDMYGNDLAQVPEVSPALHRVVRAEAVEAKQQAALEADDEPQARP